LTQVESTKKKMNLKKTLIHVGLAIFVSTGTTSFSQNTSLNFDGVNDYVQTTYSGISGGTAARSIEAWIKTTANFNPSASGSQGVIADYGSFVTGGRFTFCVLWSNAIRIEVGGNGLSGTIAVNDGNWHHVAVVYNPSATNKYSLYVDSVLDVSGNLTVATNTGSSTNLRIGQRIDNVNNFTGSIDEVRFYNYARTPSQIASERMSEYCTSPSGLMAYYKFNEGNAGVSNAGITAAIDYAGANNGTLNGFALSGSSSNYVSGTALTQGASLNTVPVSTCGSYTLPNGVVVSTSGVYNDTIISGAGCDSILSYVVTITNSHISATNTVSICDTFVMPNGSIVTSTGIYYDTLSTSGTCDTVDAYNVTILPGVNLAVTKSGNKLTSSDTWANHQWVDCGNGYSVISGATTKDYTPSVTGSYACIITRGTCSDTTACTTVTISTIGIEEELKNSFSMYPNPTNGLVVVNHPESIQFVTVKNIAGKQIANYSNSVKEIDFSSFPAGVYFVQVGVKGYVFTEKLIKQ